MFLQENKNDSNEEIIDNTLNLENSSITSNISADNKTFVVECYSTKKH